MPIFFGLLFVSAKIIRPFFSDCQFFFGICIGREIHSAETLTIDFFEHYLFEFRTYDVHSYLTLLHLKVHSNKNLVGPQSTMDRILASHLVALRSILGIPNNFVSIFC